MIIGKPDLAIHWEVEIPTHSRMNRCWKKIPEQLRINATMKISPLNSVGGFFYLII
jgi:hypothetical protein